MTAQSKQITITAAGTPHNLLTGTTVAPTTSLQVRAITVKAWTANSGYVGVASMVKATGANVIEKLALLASWNTPVPSDRSFNLEDYWVDADTNAQILNVTYWEP